MEKNLEHLRKNKWQSKTSIVLKSGMEKAYQSDRIVQARYVTFPSDTDMGSEPPLRPSLIMINDLWN